GRHMGVWQGAQPGFLRNLNERAVYRVVRENPTITGAGIARRTNLSKPTVSTVLRGLADAGLVAQSAKPFAGPGVYF
ncbi:MAG: MarR family transcriptional regulator, partial [Actinomycetota bacterium]